MEAISINWGLVLDHVIRIALAYIFAVPIALERTYSSRDIGLRTFPIVTIASAGFVLIIKSLPGITTLPFAPKNSKFREFRASLAQERQTYL